MTDGTGQFCSKIGIIFLDYISFYLVICVGWWYVFVIGNKN